MRRDNGNISVFDGVDRMAVLLYMLLTLAGLMLVASASWEDAVSGEWWDMSHFYMKQAVWIGIAWVVALVVLLLDAHIWHKYAYFLYGIGIAVMVLTLVAGREVNGARAWFEIGSMRVQPIEFAKIAIALATARMMSSYSYSIERFGDLVKVGLLLLVPLAIVWLQNDTGSGLVLGSFLFVFYREGLNKWICIQILVIVVLFILSFVVNLTALLLVLIVLFTVSEAMMNGRWLQNLRFFAALLLSSTLLYAVLQLLLPDTVSFYYSLFTVTILSVIAILAYAYRNNLRNIYILVAVFFCSIICLPTSDVLFSKLQPHQKDRIMSYLGIVDDFTKDFNVNQSKIAIGSGGFLGKGYMQGTQTKYNFVPEKHTDFIFCTAGEEFGFVGSLVLIGLLCALILRLMKMGDRQEEPFGRVYCYCVAAIFLFHMLVNIGMTIGLMPVMGIPLPLISYGGSALVAFTTMIFIAISLDAAAHRQLPQYR